MAKVEVKVNAPRPSKDLSGIQAAMSREVKEILDNAETAIANGETPEALAERVVLAIYRYRRPLRGVQAWLNRFLGPLPTDARIIEPTKEKLAEAGNYWLFGFLTSLLAIVTIFGLATVFPFLAVSPLSLMGDGVRYITGNTALQTILYVVLTFTLFRFAFKLFTPGSVPDKGGFIERFAMAEEQWFRMGSETWTMRQRIQSCVVFGLVHIQNVFYPITSLIVVGLLGGVFMVVYLRQIRKTGDYEKAALASTKLHAAHNYFSFAYLAIALVWLGVSAVIN